MKNVSVLLVGGELDGQTYTAREDETTVKIHFSENRNILTDGKISGMVDKFPEGHLYVYEQESEGSNRFVFKGTE